MTALECVRLVGVEFKDLPDDVIEQWIEFCRPFCNKKLFGKLYERALALMVCHRMKVLGINDVENGGTEVSEFGKIDDMLRVGSYSEGGVSISFNAGGQSLADKNGDYPLTIYGVEYLRLCKQCIIPIRAKGEGDWIVGPYMFW